MENLLSALATKISGSALSSEVGGRIYLDQYPPDEMPATYPYCVYFIVSSVPDKTFTEHYTDILIQFSIFSASSGGAEITAIYNDLITLFDEQTLTVSSIEAFWMREANLTTMIEDIIVADATQNVKHYAVDFEILTQEI